VQGLWALTAYSAPIQNLHRLPTTFYPFLRLPTTPSAPPAGNLPTSGDYQAFVNLQTFLAFGDYDPKIVSGLDSSKMDGPPRIYVDDKHNIKESSPTDPLHDLRTYILALRTSVEPLRRLALVRLYSQKLIKKDINAIHFLEEIYTGAPSGDSGPGDSAQDYQPDEGLRTFAQAFLCAAHPDLPTKARGLIQLEYEDTIFGRRITGETDTEPATMDNTNLHILQTTDKYKDRLSQLRGKGGPFLEDLDKVNNALENKEPIQPPSDIFGTTSTLPALEGPNISLARRVLGERAVLECLGAAEQQRRAYTLYQQHSRRRPLLGLGGISAPVTVGNLVDEARLDQLERLAGLRL
jgi:hypothetical protein